MIRGKETETDDKPPSLSIRLEPAKYFPRSGGHAQRIAGARKEIRGREGGSSIFLHCSLSVAGGLIERHICPNLTFQIDGSNYFGTRHFFLRSYLNAAPGEGALRITQLAPQVVPIHFFQFRLSPPPPSSARGPAN